jgi:CMP-N-acetylneuraminic acid synthetase|tara:strand:+ start:453 stop:1115 length:663 start_codon:yes stop_codon:yes gene_type:complete
MKVVAIIPIKQNSKRVKGKNFKLINKKPLYRYLLDKLKYAKFDEIYVDSDSKIIERYCKSKNYKFIKRLPNLKKDTANGNDLLNYHAKIIKADIYFQLFVTAPLLKLSSINKCIDFLKKNKKYDSILTSKQIYSWFWFKDKPVNYNPKILPRSQDARPIVVETTGLYGIKKNAIKKQRCRIGKKPFFYKVSEEESLDIDNSEDIKSLKYHVKNNLRSSNS